MLFCKRAAPLSVLLSVIIGTPLWAEMAPLPRFIQLPGKPEPGELRISKRTAARDPWTVAGERAAFFGRQDGRFEAWSWPNKIFSKFSIRAELGDYPVPIDVNALAAQIDVLPAETVITYSHADFTIRQHAFAARGAGQSGVPAAVVFEVDSARPMEITFSLTPEMQRMWPAPSFGIPSAEWAKGVYLLHTNDPNYTGFLAMPRTEPGIMVPYQEHPQSYPLELKLHFDPKKDAGLVFPLVFGLTTSQSPQEDAEKALAGVPALYRDTGAYYRQFLAEHVQLASPNQRLNEALSWAEVAIDQMQVRWHDETGMAAGYYESADSARPGYAWFFGRDTLWSTYGINAYGDAALTRRALDFLFRRQRADGKIMHEFSQSADAIDWKATPYFYAAADSVPLLLMAMWDYLRTTGDLDYVRQHWPALKQAWTFERFHTSPDGFYNNGQGTGWVEAWPQGMPHQEVYLAALDCESAYSLAELAGLMGDRELQAMAGAKARELAAKLPTEYRDRTDQFYAFSRNDDGTLDHTASMYPSVAWWDGSLRLPEAEPMLRRWASDEFSTDWGIRDISSKTPFYDPISYHQGSIWPLFTGWTATAEYRAGHALSGYSHLMQNANLTWEQDLGSVTELLSGDYYQPLGRSSSHQMWSSAMIVSPLLHGLFGIDWNVPKHMLAIQPHLPAAWNEATLRNLRFGDSRLTLHMVRAGATLQISATADKPTSFCITTSFAVPCSVEIKAAHTLTIPLPAVELEPATTAAPDQGARTTQLKVLAEQVGAQTAEFEVSAPGGSAWDLPLRLNRAQVNIDGAELSAGTGRDRSIHVRMPEGAGYQSKFVTFRWSAK